MSVYFFYNRTTTEAEHAQFDEVLEGIVQIFPSSALSPDPPTAESVDLHREWGAHVGAKGSVEMEDVDLEAPQHVEAMRFWAEIPGFLGVRDENGVFISPKEFHRLLNLAHPHKVRSLPKVSENQSPPSSGPELLADFFAQHSVSSGPVVHATLKAFIKGRSGVERDLLFQVLSGREDLNELSVALNITPHEVSLMCEKVLQEALALADVE